MQVTAPKTTGGAFENYAQTLATCVKATQANDISGKPIDPETAVGQAIEMIRTASKSGGRVIFIGNGGSAAIASHMAVDYSTNGKLPAMALNDGAMLTCVSNDLGYENVFSHQIEMHGRSEDLLIAISSSGQSSNILNAVKTGKDIGMAVITLSGFKQDNPLRRDGDLNFYSESSAYGVVEISHLTLCHSFCDLHISDAT